MSDYVGTCRNVSERVGSCRNFQGLSEIFGGCGSTLSRKSCRKLSETVGTCRINFLQHSDVVDGQLYQLQHQISIAIYTCLAAFVLCILIFGMVKMAQGQNVSKISIVVLVGVFSSLTAKSGAYYGNYLSIWSESMDQKLVGQSIRDFFSKLY